MSNFDLRKYLAEGLLYKEEVENVPPYLYHATYKPLLKKIEEKGLDTSDSKKAWEDSIPG